ncbi:MAG: hypothetical protein J6B87_06965 [Clostridia bacterium]|nr:hypothetical protein [Clostridia bacterium]
MAKKKMLSLYEMVKLRNSHIKVSENIFTLLSKDSEELEKRKSLVDKYGGYSNITFFSDGSVFIDGRNVKSCCTGWIKPPPVQCVPENF